MRIRLLIAASAVAALGVAVIPAQASPYAGQFRYLATGSIAVQGADGARWLLAVFATQSGPVESRPEQRLYLDLSRCVGSACTAVGRWSRPLGISTAPPGVGPEFAQYTAAGGSAKLGSLTCKVGDNDGAIGAVETIDTIGDDARDPRTAPPAAMPAGFLTGRHAARC